MFAGKFEEQAGPDISRLAPHLQEEWDHAANAQLGRITVKPYSHVQAWWSSGICRTGQPHRWQARISDRTNGVGCPHDKGHAVCPCNSLAHKHPEVAAEWDREANGERTPEIVAAGSSIEAAWRCGLCGHSWTTVVKRRTLNGAGCPQCAREAQCIWTRHPSISVGAPHMLAEWDWEANERRGWHPDKVTLGSNKKVHWVLRDECKLGLVHTWKASPNQRMGMMNSGSPFPSGQAVCACNSLAVQCPEAANLWDLTSNGGLTPSDVTVMSNKVVVWKGLDGRQRQQMVLTVVRNVRWQPISQMKQHNEVDELSIRLCDS